MNEVVHAKRPVRLPVAFSRIEVAALHRELRGVAQLVASLLYLCRRWPRNSSGFARSMNTIAPAGWEAWSCRRRSTESIRVPPSSGVGSGSFQRHGSTWIPNPSCDDAITSTNRWSNERRVNAGIRARGSQSADGMR